MPTSREVQPEVEPRGRSQLIDSAIRTVAAHGRKGATVRMIAEDASVTAGLIIHHFGTKERLLQEADDVVAGRFIEAMTPPTEKLSADETISAIAGQLSSLIGAEPELRGYVRRSLLEATASGAVIFEKLVEVTVEQICSHLSGHAPSDQDLRWTATQVVAINLAGLIFEPFLERSTKQLPFSDEQIKRRTKANARFIQAGLTDALEREQSH